MNVTASTHPRCVLAASFLSKDDAHEAAAVLKQQGFRNIWIGLTVSKEEERFYGTSRTPGDVRLRAENKIECFFDSCDETLHNKLIRRGVHDGDLHDIEYLPPYAAVLTVEGGTQPLEAMRIIRTAGGRCFNSDARHGETHDKIATT